MDHPASYSKSSAPPAVRRTRVLDHIRANGGVSVSQLAALLDVSAVTIHRDLSLLEAEGLIIRIHGGARPVDTGPGETHTNWTIRLGRMREAKHAIAVKARTCIDDDATIFLDSSTTCFSVLKEIERHPPKSLRVVTNSPAIVYSVHSPSVLVMMTPGELNQDMRVITGPWTAEFLSELSIDLALVSGAGLTVEHGLTTTQRGLADVLRAALAASERAVALVDSSKCGRASLISFASPRDFEQVIVDDGLEAGVREQFRAAEVPLTLVGE